MKVVAGERLQVFVPPTNFFGGPPMGSFFSYTVTPQMLELVLSKRNQKRKKGHGPRRKGKKRG